jgi:pyridinium-3,5-biscarboxylic acid mononucleotide synthase
MSSSVPLGFANVDLDRQERQGLPEIIYAPGKQPDEISAIAGVLLARCSGPVLVTRLEPDVAASIRGLAGDYDEPARLMTWRPQPPGQCSFAVVTGGTADGAIADEAVAVATAVGLRVTQFRDVGIAGLHRLLAVIDQIKAADVVIVIAGMEGALASAVAGLVGAPVVAVPTSTGYGAALDGVTALLAMMSSCAAGVCVVNIDSGFSAAMAAHRLAFSLSRLAAVTP